MSLADYNELRRPKTSPNTHTEPKPSPNTNTEPKNEPQKQMKKELVDITEYKYDYKDETEEFLTPASFMPKRKTAGKYDHFALCLRRRMDKSGKDVVPGPVQLEIRDPAIRKALQTCLRDVRYIDLCATPIKISKPFRELFWFREEIEEYSSSAERTAEDRESLELLTGFIKERLHARIKAHVDVVKNGCIEFETLWTIFRPGSVVICVADGLRRAFLVSRVTPYSLPIFEITVFEWNCSESRFGIIETTVNIESYTGTCPILELDVFPLDCLEETPRNALVEELVRGGRRWKELTPQCHKQYKGVAWKIERKETEQDAERRRADLFMRDERSSYTRTRFHVNGRIVLDHSIFSQFNPGSLKPLLPKFTTLRPKTSATRLSTFPSEKDMQQIFERVEKDPSYEMSDFQAFLAPRLVHGYSLEDKCWMEFVVDDVKDIQWDAECFGKLQMDSLAQNTLETLISQHAKSGHGFNDIVTGKGKGLAILLHGPPGSGKTLTAEVISEHTQKPLLRVTSGELGTGATDAESQLSKCFKLAQAWQAILLLDEADVFLAKRRSEDIVRNAFVTVFLRSMEYYSGILLLTTNRVQDFDEAFQSRIHLQLPYMVPDAHRRTAIWRNILGSQNDVNQLDDSSVERLGNKLECNGREIKNLISMALSISQGQGKPLSEEIIEGLYDLNFGKKRA